VTTGSLYYACHELDTHNGIIVTGSHNGADINGFKIVIDRQTLSKEQLMALYHRIQRQDYRSGQGQVTEQNINEAYLDRIQGDIQLSRPLKVVLDAANGIAGPIGLQLLKTMGLDVIPLNCDVDGNFPNHQPDPSDPANLAALQAAVTENKADIGIAYDGDGDRIAVVDELGNIILPDRILMYLAKDIISRQPGCDVVYDIKSSRRLNSFIAQFGGRPTMWKTGHSLMKAKMTELNAVLGGELSGHIYFRDRWYGFDDSLYASARLLELLSHQFETVSQVFSEFPDDVSTAEITISSDDKSKFTIIQKLASEPSLQKGARVSTIDGIRSDFSDGWGLVRASNTSPKLTLRFAGDDQEALQRIQQLYREALQQHAPELQLPF
jgi:phosphomannomutase/phosphoglucomutase